MKEITESKIQQEGVMWFNNTYCLKHQENRGIIFSVPNESQEDQRRKVNTGLLRGASDTIVIFRGQCLFVEWKTKTGVQSERQKDFQKRIEENGFKYYLVRSLQEFKEIIEKI
jgi:hypothetical protein